MRVHRSSHVMPERAAAGPRPGTRQTRRTRGLDGLRRAPVAVGTCVSSHAPRPDPYVRLSRIRLPPRVQTASSCRMRPSACDTLTRFCARHVLCWSAFPLVPALRSTDSAAADSAADDSAAGRHFVRRLPSYYGEVRLLVSVHHRLRLLVFPMRTVPLTQRRRPDTRPPSFRCDPFARDVAFDPGRASAPRIAVPHMLPSSE